MSPAMTLLMVDGTRRCADRSTVWTGIDVLYHSVGEQFISTSDQLPIVGVHSSSSVIVQPFFRPFLGNGCMARKVGLS